jgi:hypothetical protein
MSNEIFEQDSDENIKIKFTIPSISSTILRSNNNTNFYKKSNSTTFSKNVIIGDTSRSIDEDVNDNDDVHGLSIQESIISTLLDNDGSKDEPLHPYLDFDTLKDNYDIGKNIHELFL